MNINFPWKFHQNAFTLTITFNVLNVSTEFVLIYRPHPVQISVISPGGSYMEMGGGDEPKKTGA